MAHSTGSMGFSAKTLSISPEKRLTTWSRLAQSPASALLSTRHKPIKKDLIEDRLKLSRVRADTFGYLQRSFAGCVSDRDASEAREVGEIAVQTALWDDVDGSIAIRRPVLDYSVKYECVPLEKVAREARHMPDEFINKAGNDVTQDFQDYARPLAGSGFPEAWRLRGVD